MKKNEILRLVLSAMMLAIGLALPFLTGQIPAIGSMLLPMHIPAMLCGFICGWPYGLFVGFVMPLVRSAIFGMPAMTPTALCMAFELAAYGAVCGIVFANTRKDIKGVYAALIAALIIGRAVWGLASFAIYGLLMQSAFTAAMFVAGAFARAWPGIAVQLIIIPIILMALKEARLIPLEGRRARA